MEVETFECEEAVCEGEKATEEALELIDKLGLDGQKTYYQGENEEKPAKCCLYHFMTKEEQAVYRALCPRTVALKDYESGPVPIRVLQVAAHVADTGLGKLEVWCPKDATDPDPILVAQLPSKAPYLLARWGPVLEEFAVLKAKARERLIALRQGALQRIRSEMEKDLISIEACVDLHLLGEGSHSTIEPYYSSRW